VISLRQVTQEGRVRFNSYLQQLRESPTLSPPLDELACAPFSAEFEPHIDVPDTAPASSRFELGRWLCELMVDRNVGREKLVQNHGIWTFLAATWFDSLCPTRADGTRVVRESSRYVCSGDYTDYSRHLVAASWDQYSLHGKYARLMLHCPLPIHTDFGEQLGSRQFLVSNHNLMMVFDALYWDQSTEQAKRGAQSRTRAGNFLRLIAFARQLELTYDLYTMSPEQVISMLPPEFAPWVRGTPSGSRR